MTRDLVGEELMSKRVWLLEQSKVELLLFMAHATDHLTAVPAWSRNWDHVAGAYLAARMTLLKAVGEIVNPDPEDDGFHAMTRWHRDDIVQAAKDNLQLDITEEQAEDWLINNERHIADRTVELGWDVIYALMDKEDFTK